MNKLIFCLIILFSISQLQAMNFVPIELEDQLKESDAVIVGRFLGNRFKKLPNDEIITIGSFKIKTQTGLKYSNLLNRNKFDVYYPGGEWQGIEYKVQGSPEFRLGEDSLLFLKKTGYGFKVQNLALSKYEISYRRDEISFHSVVFPDHPRLGQFGMMELNSLLRERFNETLEEVPRFSVLIHKKNPSRRIASYSESRESDDNDSSDKNPMVGLGSIFILLAISRKKIFWSWKKYL